MNWNLNNWNSIFKLYNTTLSTQIWDHDLDVDGEIYCYSYLSSSSLLHPFHLLNQEENN